MRALYSVEDSSIFKITMPRIDESSGRFYTKDVVGEPHPVSIEAGLSVK
jgi:hypothetical protein